MEGGGGEGGREGGEGGGGGRREGEGEGRGREKGGEGRGREKGGTVELKKNSPIKGHPLDKGHFPMSQMLTVVAVERFHCTR